MKRLIVDIGNSRIKSAVFDENNSPEARNFERLEDLAAYANKLNFDACLVSSVNQDNELLKEILAFEYLYLTKDTPLPIANGYESPETLGVDRKAAVVGARANFPIGNLLAIDLGTCITFDFLDDQNVYQGGGISPGMSMRFRAMHQQTARLPLVNFPNLEQIQLIGKHTEGCMQSGVYHGIRFEIEGFVDALKQQHQDLKVIICGGDSIYFETLTKDHIFVIPNLVLYGLDRILTYNVNKK
ncbi:type III pantothenate kinase [Belliella sp. DSM 111904]|uniref:Type III pantothenate kinase n=1 Tax=Belliella filtrata TaxID=2923435 RepID=A0ABS9UUF7_9BACT|nr:type III pantothenate kinase [Belliella filtrata]MCH7407801.1 type III pantothenate kinase [Belliella filtrata]